MIQMFPGKAHGPTVFDFNSVGVDAACWHQARRAYSRFVGMPLLTPPMNAIAPSRHCFISLSSAIGLSFTWPLYTSAAADDPLFVDVWVLSILKTEHSTT